MKKLAKSLLVILVGLFMSVNVMADVQTGKTEPDYSTDYYMIVESKAGGIDFYSQPDFDSTKLNDEQIPNGTALHITGEVEDKENNRTWGYTEYHKMKGYAPLDECRPAQSRKEAIESELYIAGKDHVNYSADYDVKAYAEEGTQKLYQGPGEKYGEVPGVRDIENGEILHITEDAEMVDGSYWGVTTVDGTEGWMDLEKTEEWLKEHPEAQTEAVDAEPVTEETVDTEAAAENAVSAEPVENSEETTASKATKKSEKKKSGKETVCRGLCTGFLNARCQTSLSGSHPTGRPHAAPGRQRSGLFYGGKCLWQKQSRAAIRQRRRNRNGSAGASGSSSPVSLQAAKPCSKPLSSLLSGRPVNGLRNGWGKKPVKRLKSGEKQLKGRRGHGTIIVSCPCS